MRLPFFDSLATDFVLVVFVIVCSETKLLELSTFLLLFSKCEHNISFISKSCFSRLFIRDQPTISNSTVRKTTRTKSISW